MSCLIYNYLIRQSIQQRTCISKTFQHFLHVMVHIQIHSGESFHLYSPYEAIATSAYHYLFSPISLIYPRRKQ